MTRVNEVHRHAEIGRQHPQTIRSDYRYTLTVRGPRGIACPGRCPDLPGLAAVMNPHPRPRNKSLALFDRRAGFLCAHSQSHAMASVVDQTNRTGRELGKTRPLGGHVLATARRLRRVHHETGSDTERNT